MTDNPSLSLVPLPGTYSIHSLEPGQPLPQIQEGFHSVTVTEEEISVLCLEEKEIDSQHCSKGWKGLKVEGPLDLSLTGILHDLSKPLKEAGISIFAIFTYDTDYLFIPESSFDRSIQVLSDSYTIRLE